MPPKRPTLATIASAAGVSITTVSKVLNGRDDVAPATRAMVEDLLRRHYYIGRGGTRHPTVELLFHGRLSAYSTEVIHGVVEAATEVGVAVVLSVRASGQQSSGPKSPTAWALDLAAAGRQAVISVTNEMSAEVLGALSGAGLPLVVVDPVGTPVTQVTSVGSTNFAGGLAATQHLLSLGHRRIAYVGGPMSVGCNQARLHGYRGAMEAAGVPVTEEYVRLRQFGYQEGRIEAAALLQLPRPPTAVFAGNDEIAVGVIEAARALGLRVPEHLSVVGFDDTQIAQLASPPLTTVHQPLRDMGTVALRTALRLAAGERVDSHHVELATRLIVRGSTDAPGP